jgi:hypothetical protein
MARLFLTGINLNNNELSNAVITNSAPATKVAGNLWYSSQHLTLRGTSTDKTIANQDDTFYIGTQAIALNQGTGTITSLPGVTSVNGTTIPSSAILTKTSDNLSVFAATTSSQLAGVISDETGSGSLVFANTPTLVTPILGVATATSINKVALTAPATSATLTLADGSTLATSGAYSVTLTATGATNVTLPTSGVLATQAYVDAAAVGIDWKPSVRAATTANITLSAPQTIDGVSVIAGDRVLVKNQTTGSENGIYVVAASTWSRATDADAAAEVTSGLAVFVEEGTTNADSGWVLTNNGTITIGTTALTFTQFTGLGQVTAGAGLTKSGNTLDVVGVTDRITVNADSVDIASTYAGQTSITTVGTLTSGTLGAGFTTVATARGGTGLTSFTSGGAVYATSTSALTTGTLPITAGGTGATDAAGARSALSATGKYSATNSAITVSGGIATWQISAATHSLGSDAAKTVTLYYVDTTLQGAIYEVEADVYIVTNATTATSNFGFSCALGDVILTWSSASNVSAGAYRVVIVG